MVFSFFVLPSLFFHCFPQFDLSTCPPSRRAKWSCDADGCLYLHDICCDVIIRYKEEYDPEPTSDDVSSDEEDDGQNDERDGDDDDDAAAAADDDDSDDGRNGGGGGVEKQPQQKEVKKQKMRAGGRGGGGSKRNRHPNAEHRKLFEGDTDDCFRLGISLTRTTVNLYSDFYTADILIASPLGLRLIIGADGEKHQEYDFLSSIEIAIIDQAESMLMQNWEHVLHMMQHTNLQPKETRNTDFSRLQRWSIEGWSKHFRQTVLLSSFSAPEFNLLYKKHCSNLYAKIPKRDNPVHHCISVEDAGGLCCCAALLLCFLVPFW